MAVPRVKKPKQKMYTAKELKERELEMIKDASQLMFDISIRTLVQCMDFTKEQLDFYIESYTALMREVADGRCSLSQCQYDTKVLTGIDTQKIVNEVLREIDKQGGKDG